MYFSWKVHGDYYRLATLEGSTGATGQIVTVPIGIAFIIVGIGMWFVKPEWAEIRD